MAFAQKTWKDRVAEYINRRILTKEDGTTELVSVERSEGTISQEGDAFSAENMNDLEQRIANEFSEQNKNIVKYNETEDCLEIYFGGLVVGTIPCGFKGLDILSDGVLISGTVSAYKESSSSCGFSDGQIYIGASSSLNCHAGVGIPYQIDFSKYNKIEITISSGSKPISAGASLNPVSSHAPGINVYGNISGVGTHLIDVSTFASLGYLVFKDSDNTIGTTYISKIRLLV